MKTSKAGQQRARVAEPVGTSAGRLARLEDLDDYKVADGEPDPRGWDVKGRDGQRIGTVKNLLVDPQAMRVRYLEVELDDQALRGRDGERRCVHVPVASARLDDDDDNVLVDLDRAAVGLLGMVDRDRSVDGDGSSDDTRRFFGKRRDGRGDDAYLVRHEEQLAVGKRAVRAGEVTVQKSVETERVTETVPLSHEEVTVERRPISADARAGRQTEIREDELRVPVMAEELVTQKRVVPVEEVVVQKATVTENETVDATIRKERIDVDRQKATAPREARDRR